MSHVCINDSIMIPDMTMFVRFSVKHLMEWQHASISRFRYSADYRNSAYI